MRRHRSWWDLDGETSNFLGFGGMNDLRDADSDLRNPALAGLRSVSYAAAVAMRRQERPGRSAKIGFDTTSHLKRR